MRGTSDLVTAAVFGRIHGPIRGGEEMIEDLAVVGVDGAPNRGGQSLEAAAFGQCDLMHR